MIEQLGRLAKHTGIYGAGLVLSKAVGFLMIPVYTRYLLPRDYGLLELLDLIIFFVGIFAAMGVQSAIFRFYAAYESEQDKKEVIGTALLYYASMSLILSLAVVLFAPAVARLVLGSSEFVPFVRIVAFILLFSNLAEVPLAYWRAQERATLYVCVSLGRTLLGMLLVIYFLAGLQWGVAGVLYANLVSTAIPGLTMFTLVLLRVPPRIVKNKLKQMLRYGAPLISSTLASFALVFSDRFFLRHFGNLTEVGIYSLGYKLAMVVTVLVSVPFSLGWQSQQFELAKRDDSGQMYAKVQTYLLLISAFFGLGVALFAQDVIHLIATSSYWPASRIVPLIVLCYVLENVRVVALSGILVQRATQYLVPISILVAGINLGLNYLLISRYLAMGAALATLLSYAVNLALCSYLAQRVYFVQYEYGRNALVLGLAILVYLTGTLSGLGSVGSILFKISLLLLFLVIAVKLLDRQEQDMFRELGLRFARHLPGTRF